LLIIIQPMANTLLLIMLSTNAICQLKFSIKYMIAAQATIQETRIILEIILICLTDKGVVVTNADLI
jgi:hypothetical protein